MHTREEIKVNEFGEIVSADITTIKKVKAEEFCQIYLRDNEEFYTLSKAENNVLAVCWSRSVYYNDPEFSYPGNKVTLDEELKDVIAAKTKLAHGTIKNAISSLVKKKMLLKDERYKSIYYLNPKFFFKGQITDRTKLIKHIVEYRIAEG